MQSIREFVQKLQKSRGITQADLAKAIGYKSQTSLVRIVQETANEESLHKFARMLRESPDIHLTAAESAALDLLVEKRMLGADEYAAMESMRRLLQVKIHTVDDVWVVDGDRRINLMDHYANKKNLHLFMLNSQKVQLMASLAELLKNTDAVLDHYLYADDSLASLASVLQVVMPLLHEAKYSGYICRREDENMPCGLMTADILMGEYINEQGEVQHDLITFTKPDEGILALFEGSMSTMKPMLDEMLQNAQPLRNDLLLHTGKEDYMTYVRYCSDLERDRAVYRLKPDFGIEQVPVHIWRKAFEEGPLGGQEEFIAALNNLVQISEKRHQNAMEKKQPTCHVLKTRAVWEFVKTGRLSDMFFGFRPLTWEERLEVLQLLLRQQMNNPWFNLLLFKEDNVIRDDEVVLYDDLALFIIKPGTDYSLDGDHAESMVTNKDMLKVFKHYYQESILQFHVKSESETKRLLVELIEYCQKQIAQKA